jgi:hypothetical protein
VEEGRGGREADEEVEEGEEGGKVAQGEGFEPKIDFVWQNGLMECQCCGYRA